MYYIYHLCLSVLLSQDELSAAVTPGQPQHPGEVRGAEQPVVLGEEVHEVLQLLVALAALEAGRVPPPGSTGAWQQGGAQIVNLPG